MIKQLSVLIILFTCSIFYMSCVDNENKVNTPITKTTTDSIPVFNFEELEPYLYTDSDKTHIVNFWAMWCAPCVEELPIIQEYQKNNPDVDILLVSLDFPQDIETELKPFLKEKGITSKVVLLDDADANSWIDKIDPNWSGALPFTIIHNNKTRSFFEGNFKSLLDLENQIYKTINYADYH